MRNSTFFTTFCESNYFKIKVIKNLKIPDLSETHSEMYAMQGKELITHHAVYLCTHGKASIIKSYTRHSSLRFELASWAENHQGEVPSPGCPRTTQALRAPTQTNWTSTSGGGALASVQFP